MNIWEHDVVILEIADQRAYAAERLQEAVSLETIDAATAIDLEYDAAMCEVYAAGLENRDPNFTEEVEALLDM